MPQDRDDLMAERDAALARGDVSATEPKENINEKLFIKENLNSSGLASRYDRDTGHSAPTENDRFSVMPTTADLTHNERNYGAKSYNPRAIGNNGSAGDMPSLRSGTPTTSLKHAASRHISTPSEERVTSENYTKIYQKRQREREAMEQAQRRDQATANAVLAKKQLEQDTTLRNQARHLREQIQWWRAQIGQGSHDTTYIAGMISSLESQLNAIPPRYWN